MRITLIIEGRNKNVRINVPEWFCAQEEIDRNIATQIKDTTKAILLSLIDKEVWIPKSIYTVIDTRNQKGLDSFD